MKPISPSTNEELRNAQDRFLLDLDLRNELLEEIRQGVLASLCGGKKGTPHTDPADPPRQRANNRRGRGTYANDRPPIVGTIGRQTGQVRLRVTQDTTVITRLIRGWVARR